MITVEGYDFYDPRVPEEYDTIFSAVKLGVVFEGLNIRFVEMSLRGENPLTKWYFHKLSNEYSDAYIKEWLSTGTVEPYLWRVQS